MELDIDDAADLLLEIGKTFSYIEALKSIPAQQLQMEARLHRKLANLFGGAADEVLEGLRRSGHVPNNPSDLKKVLLPLTKIQGRIQDSLTEESIAAAEYGRQVTLDRFKKAGFAADMAPQVPLKTHGRERIQFHVFEASRRTMNRLTGNVMENLTSSYDRGLGIEDAAERLRRSFVDMKDYELRRVARTEINSLQNEGAQQIIEEVGAGYEMWWTAEDERVRDGEASDADHVRMHGQIIRVGDEFSNGLHHPGDRSGGQSTIQEWINCRCRIVPFLMPEGKMAPPGKTFFYEHELVDVKEGVAEPKTEEPEVIEVEQFNEDYLKDPWEETVSDIEVYENLSKHKDEIAAMKAYKGTEYREINVYLRQGDEGLKKIWLGGESLEAVKGRVSKKVQALDKAFNREAFTLKKPVTVYRGVTESTSRNLLRDKSFTDNGFLSTSTTIKKTGRFSSKDSDGITNFIRLHLQPGQKAVSFKSESEVLLPRGQKLKLLAVENVKEELPFIHSSGADGKVRILHCILEGSL